METKVADAGRIIFVTAALPEALHEKRNFGKYLQTSAFLSAIEEVSRERDVVWVGWQQEEAKMNQMTKMGHFYTYSVPYISSEQYKAFYNGFCKTVLWPLFHYESVNYEDSEEVNSMWKNYSNVNKLFAKAIEGIYREGDYILIQDYHLMMVPAFLRKKLNRVKLGFYFHVPWPSSEIFRVLTQRKIILESLLECDIIGFQTFQYVNHFLSACSRLLGLRPQQDGVETLTGKFVRLEVFPMGIKAEEMWRDLEKPNVQQRIEELKQSFSGKKIIVSRDVVESIRGISQKFKSFAYFLKQYPEWKGKVILCHESFDNESMMDHEKYKEITEEIEKLVGALNGEFGTVEYTPINYLRQPLSHVDSIALFAIADVALITPLRDGMNLDSYQFVACQNDKKSPVILSEFAGAAHCLSGVLMVNPYDEAKVAKAIKKALEMPETEKTELFQLNEDYMKHHGAKGWLVSCCLEMSHIAEKNLNTEEVMRVKKLSVPYLMECYSHSSQRLFFFDYDGTLAALEKLPHLAKPTREIFSVLQKLSRDPRNTIYVITGRDRKTIEEWLGHLPIGFSCEHGAFFCDSNLEKETKKETNLKWKNTASELNLEWKDQIAKIMENFADRTPGSLVETKEIGITWHYRNADPDFAEYQKNELVHHLLTLPGLPIDILLGNKNVEVRPQGINKGYIVKQIMHNNPEATASDFILCIGDDKTDEDMFAQLEKFHTQRKYLFTVTVEKKPSMANYYVKTQKKVVAMLNRLANMVEPSSTFEEKLEIHPQVAVSQ